MSITLAILGFSPRICKILGTRRCLVMPSSSVSELEVFVGGGGGGGSCKMGKNGEGSDTAFFTIFVFLQLCLGCSASTGGGANTMNKYQEMNK